MKHNDFRSKLAQNELIDIQNVINIFGKINRRRLYEWQKKRIYKKAYQINLTENNFKSASLTVKKKLELNSYTVEIENIF